MDTEVHHPYHGGDTADPNKGPGDALRPPAEQPYGPWLLAGIGLGLLCYVLYCFASTRFRHINH